MTGVSKRACPVCKSKSNSVFMKGNAYNNRDHIELLKCSNCGFVYSKSVNIDYSSFGKAASKQTTPKLQKISDSQGISELVSIIMDKSGIKQGKMLDFGCGVGLMLRGFKDRGFDALGIEESEAFRKMLAKDGISSVSSLTDISDQTGQFDIVIIKDVIEHLENPLDILNQLITFISPSGFLYIRAPNRYAYPFHWAVDTKGHVNHFTPAQLKKIINNHGLGFHGYIDVFDISSRAGRLYNYVFWKLRHQLPMTHQISLLYKNNGL